MAREPSPPTTLPSEFVETCADLSVAQLREVAEYVETLANHREQSNGRDETDETADDQLDDGSGEMPAVQDDDRPDDVPSGASVTVKEINDNRYRYWQWRDGEKIKSKYIGPVNPDD